jgi:hypothetical protein
MDAMKKFMWPISAYEELPTLPADAVALPVTYRQVSLDRPEPALAQEEHIIADMKRASLVSDSPVLAPTDPAVQQASFRARFDPNTRVIPEVNYDDVNLAACSPRPKNEEARRRSVLAIGSTGDAPVLAAGSSMPITDTASTSL